MRRIKQVASSPIRINEATIDELQALKGIGPKRAAYVVSYRDEVAPISNTFDLAVATGLSLKASLLISYSIDWSMNGTLEKRQLIPVAITSIISIWLVLQGFNQLTDQPWSPPGSYFNLALAFVLMGGLAATGDIAISAIRRRPSETSWVFYIAILLLASGLIILINLVLVPENYPDDFTTTLNATSNFILFTFIALVLIYGPAGLLRLTVSDERNRYLAAGINLYDYGQLIVVAISLLVLHRYNTKLMLEEIFSLWCTTLILVNGVELTRGNSAFVSMLSELDQGRMRFIAQRSVAGQWFSVTSRRYAGFLAIVTGTMLLVVTLRLWIFVD